MVVIVHCASLKENIMYVRNRGYLAVAALVGLLGTIGMKNGTIPFSFYPYLVVWMLFVGALAFVPMEK